MKSLEPSIDIAKIADFQKFKAIKKGPENANQVYFLIND